MGKESYYKNGRLVGYVNRHGREVVGCCLEDKAKDPDFQTELAEDGLEVGRYDGNDPLGLKTVRLLPIVLKVQS